MSIQSTRVITRNNAIRRICEINLLAGLKDYRGIESATYEPDYAIKEFVDNYNGILDVVNWVNWTNYMLAEQMDDPFYRFSIFENYRVVDGEE